MGSLNWAGTTCAPPARCVPIDVKAFGENKTSGSSGGSTGSAFKPN